MTSSKISSLSSLVVWHGHPTGVFPPGDHVYPADLDAANELLAALRADFTETHLVSTSMLRSDHPQPWPFRLVGLKAFLKNHAARLDHVLISPAVVANTREHGRHLVARLRELGAPNVIIDHQQAELERVSSILWKPSIDFADLIPDVLGSASIVNVESRTSHGWELAVDADIGNILLLAASCLVLPGTVDKGELDKLDWTSLLDIDRVSAPIPPGFVRVRPGVDFGTVEALAFADAGDDRASANAPALLRVVIPNDD